MIGPESPTSHPDLVAEKLPTVISELCFLDVLIKWLDGECSAERRPKIRDYQLGPPLPLSKPILIVSNCPLGGLEKCFIAFDPITMIV